MAYTEEIASIRVRAVLDKTELNRSIADMSSKRYDVNVGVTSSGMNTLEKNLRGVLSSTQNFLYANPLRPQVDLKNINRLEAKINELNNNYKNLEIKVRVKPDFTGIDENLIDGLVKGITANTSKIEKAGELVADKLVQSIKDKLEIRSPSRVSAKIGQNFMEGMDIGLDDKKLNAKLSTIEARFTQAKNRILSQASTGKINTDQAYNQLSRLSRDIDSQKRTIAGSSDLSLKVDDSALTNLNNKLDLTIVQLKNIQSYIDQNPIRMRVDDSEVNTEKVSKRKYVRNDTTQELKSTFNSFADDVGKTISKSINKEIKKSQSGGLFASLFSFPKAVFAGFQQGIGIAIAQQWSNGFVSVFEKRFKTSLENIGASEAANFLKFGENIGDALVKKLGIVEGLKGLEPILKNVESAFAEIVPVDLIDAKIAKVEKRVIKLLDDFSKMSSLQTNLRNVSNLSKSVGDIATIPIEGFDRRRDRIVREAAANIRKNYDPNKATPVEAGVNGVTIVSGGFAGAGGKSGGMVAQKLGILLGNQQQVIPVNNPKTDVSASNLELGMPRWLSEAGLRIAQHNIFSGINPDSVDMAKKAYDVYKQDPTKKITLGGYSAGGFVAHDAKEILKTLGVPANAFAIGTPIWGKKGDLQAGEFKSVVREMDGVAQVANKFKVVFGELSEKFTTIVPGYGHELANYLSQPESQKVILNQVYGKNAPEPGKNQRSPEAYRAVGYKADAENLMSSLEYQLTNPLKDPLVAKKFLIQTYADMKRIQGDLNTAIEELDGEMQEELKAYVNGLQEGIDLIEQTVGKPSAPASKTADAAKELENSQEKQRSEMRSLMETLNKKDIIEPIGKELGLKNVRNTNKSDLINSILNTADPSAIKKFLPHTTPPSADVIKEITARKSLATYELKNLLVNTRENITAISAKNYGKKSGRDISDVSEAIEKEYQIIISMLSSGVEKDAKALLEQQKLELGKIRAKSIREVTTQVSSEAVNRNRSGGGEVTQLASVDPRKMEELYKTVNVQHNYRQIFSEVARFSGVKFDPSKLPQLIVDDKRLEKVGANALYDIKKNKIIIHNSLKEILENSPDQLKEHAKHLSTIVHESRHALQFRYGKVSLNDISRGVNMGVTPVPPDFMSRQASFNAALSVDVAKKGSKRPLPQKLLKAIHTVESDAYGFSDLYTKRITENLVNQNIQKIPDVQQIDEPTERIGTFMDRIGENITKIQNRFKLVQHGFKILGQEIKEFLLSLPGGRLIADLIGRFRDLFSPKVGAVAQANINGSVKPPTPASTTVGNNLIGGVGSIAKEATAAVKQLLGDIKSIYKEFTKDLPPGNFLTSGIEKIGKMGDLFKAVVVGFIGFKLLSPIFDRVKQFADDSTRVAIDMQRINNQVIASAGGGSGGMAYLREIRKNSEDLRLNIKDSLEASAGFSASTVGTSIEGQLGTETFKNFQTLLAARGTTTERSKNFLLALEQSASKGVQAEELRGQMAEAVPGIISIFARSQGLDNRGFAAKMKNTPGGLDQSVLFEASQQAKAENLVNISKAFDTVDSAQNRFNNNVMKLQESIGGLSLEFEKVKFNTLSEGFELISNNIELISKGISVLLIYAGQSIIITALRAISQGWLTASASIKQYIADYLLNIRIQTAGMTPLQKAGFLANNSFDKLSSTIGGFADMAKPFVAIAIGMEAISNVANLLRIQFTDLSGDIKKYADTAKNANIEIEKSLKTGVVDENSGIGADNRWSMRVKKMMENPLRALNPFDQTNREGYKKASDTYSQGNKLLKESEKLRGIADSDDLNKKIAELAEIDKKRGEIAAKLSAQSQLSPGDSPASKALRQQQESLIKDRADRVVSVGAIQSQLESRVKELKLLRDSVKSQAENGYITKDSYLRGVTAIDEELKKLESTQDRITKSIGESKNAFDIFKKSITSATVAAEDIRASIDTRSSARRTIISEQYARGNYNQADRNILNQFSDIRTAKEQRDAQARAINQQSELFRSQQATNVLSAYGVNESTGVARVGQLANGAEGNNKYILEEYAKLQQSKQDFVKTQQQLADSNASLRDLVTETSKSIKDYYTGIEREIKQTNIEINKISAGFQFTDSQNRIREALTNGADNMFTQFADGIIANIDKAKQRSDASYDSSSTILGIQNKIADSQKSYTEFSKTLPKIPIELDFSSVNSSENVNAVNDSLAETQNRLDDTSVQFNNINGDVDRVGDSLDRNNQSIYDQIGSITDVLDTTGQIVQQTDLWNDGLNQVQPTTDNINESFTSITTSIESLVSQTLNWIDSLSKGEGVLGGLVASARSLFAGTTGNSLVDGAVSTVKGWFGGGSQQASSGVIAPVSGVITSGFGKRKPPVKGASSFHDGMDYGVGTGTPVKAPTSGVISRVFNSNNGGGKVVELKSTTADGKEITQSFLHLSEQLVKAGQAVKQGEVIAKSGATGIGSGAHLHWRVHINGKPIDPKNFLNMGVNIPASGGSGGASSQTNSGGRGSVDAASIAKKNKLQSLVVADTNGKIISSYNSTTSPDSPASTIKLIIGDLATDKLDPNKRLTVNRSAMAEYEDKFKAGQSYTVKELLTEMLKESNNTAANTLIQGLGGFGAVNSMVKNKGYSGSSINNYLSPTGGNSTGVSNRITAKDATKAMSDLLNDPTTGGRISSDALRSTRNFKYSGEAGGKIGNNSRVIGNVGIVNINGKEYLVTAYANFDGNKDVNRKIITNATNEISRGLGAISGGGSSRSVSPPASMGGISQGGNKLTQAEYNRLTPLGKELYKYQQDPRILAIGDTVARAEGTDFRNNSKNFGYSMMIGGQHDTDFSRHPFAGNSGTGSRVRSPYRVNKGLASTASGRYQMMDFNYSRAMAKKQNPGWDSDLAKIFQGDNPGSFSPAVQDLYFIASLKSRGVLDEVLAGDFQGALSNPQLANHYASLQSGRARSAYKGQGTPEGMTSNTVPFAKQRLQARSSGGGSATTTIAGAFSSQESAYNGQIDVEQQRLARDQRQQELQDQRENNQNLRAFDRNIRDLKDQRRASSREVSDSHFEAGGIKSPTDQYKKRITDNDRKYDDMIRTREQKLRETNEAIQSGQSLLQTLPPEAVVERTKVTEGLKQNQDYVKQLTSEISQLRQDQKTSANNITKEFNQEEEFKDEKFNFQLAGQNIEQQRQVLEQAKKQVAITPDNTLQEEINLTEKDISLKSDQLDLETKLQDIRERLFKKEISADRAKKEAEALFSLNDEKQRTIELTFKQAEAERAQTYGQIAIDKATKTLEYQNELRAEQIKQLGILQRRNPLIDSMKNIDLERQTSTDSNINDTRKKVFEATYNKNYTEDERAGLIARENELSAIRQKNIDDEAALRRDEQAKTDIENRNSRAQALRDFTSQSEIELKRSRATKITDLGGNPIRANRLNREAGVMEETNRFKTSLEDLESKVASLRFQGIEVSEAAVTSTRENLEAIHKLNIDDLNRKYMTFGETLNSVARQGFGTLSSSLTDLILKGGSFSDVLDNFANTILSGALNAGMSSLFGGLFGGLFYDGGIVGYADGGVIGAHKKERAMSGREPRMIMAHVGELLVPADRVEELKGMGIGTHEILGYANGGVVGSPPASTIRPTRSGGTVKIETTVINKQEYASVEQVQAAMDQAQRMGAMGGFEMVQDKMTNDANFRSATGLNR